MKTYKEIYVAVAGKSYNSKLEKAKAIASQILISNPADTEDIKILAYEYLEAMFGVWFDPTIDEDEELHHHIEMSRQIALKSL